LEDWTTDEVKRQISKLRPEERRLQKLLTQNEDIETDISNAQEKLEIALETESAIKRLAGLEKSLATLQKKVELKSQAILQSREDDKRGYAPYVARQLKLGQPCPVCGSKDHPKPIKPSTLFDAEKTVQLQEELDYLKEDLAETKSDLKAAKLLAGKKSLPSAELRAKSAQLKKKAAQSLKVSEQFVQVSTDLALLEENLESITAYARTSKDVEALTKRLHVDMTKAGLDDVGDLRTVLTIDVDKLQSQIARHNTRIAEITSILNQKEYKGLPEEASLEERKGELLEEQSELQSKRSAITGRLALNEKVNENLDSLAASILEELTSMDEILEKGKPYLDLASYAKGKNSLGLTLTNFVLQERLEMILERASLHLRRISNGKYEFRLQEERLGHQRKAGLGITVMDYFAGKERPAETLSGGETFYASLALALGLAEVVKADQGGVELGTLFIDEGFGSLSDNTLDEVLDVLEDLRSQDRIIGVISHVEGMKGQIPARLEVRASAEVHSSVKMAVAGMD
jgi:exonuclease SbcC